MKLLDTLQALGKKTVKYLTSWDQHLQFMHQNEQFIFKRDLNKIICQTMSVHLELRPYQGNILSNVLKIECAKSKCRCIMFSLLTEMNYYIFSQNIFDLKSC